jgi:hypothetical protein
VKWRAGHIRGKRMEILSLFSGMAPARPAAMNSEFVHVHLYLIKLLRGDRLADGSNPIPTVDQTMLIWIDREPETRFAHPSWYVLISPDRTQVIDGEWWPTINNKSYFPLGPQYPLGAPALAGAMPLGQRVMAHVFPYKLVDQDSLMDGDGGPVLPIDEETLYLWIDLHHGMRFAHDTLHLLISANGVRVIEGRWWPVLNGQRVDFSTFRAAVPSPVPLRRGGRKESWGASDDTAAGAPPSQGGGAT